MAESRGSWGQGWPEERVSDADRERVIAILRGHTVDGRLSLDEFSDRVGEVYAARTFRDLEHTLRELPPASIARRRVSSRRGLPVRGWRAVAVAFLVCWVVAQLLALVFPLLLIGCGVMVVSRRHRHPRFTPRTRYR